LFLTHNLHFFSHSQFLFLQIA